MKVATSEDDFAKKVAKEKGMVGTMQLTLRPSRSLYVRYVEAAADRSKHEGRTVSVQEVMLEILERGLA